LFEKSKLILAWAIGNRGYTGKTRLSRWRCAKRTTLVKNLDFSLVRVGGLRLCSSEYNSPKTFKTSS
jgi:hypothetical protein